MDRTKQKAKKEKPNKYVDKEKSPSFIADVKTLKENLKIREILRTVKMNSSMRIKAPKGSKVMQNKDFHDGEDIFEGTTSNEGQELSEPPSATNLHIVNKTTLSDTSENESVNESSEVNLNDSEEDLSKEVEINMMHKSKSLSTGLEDTGRERVSTPTSLESPVVLPPRESPLLRGRDRKLSLDHTMLSKREGLSQSEVDLHSIGKSPLERKSSFFRKKMDSFLKNTTEIFKRQTSTNSVQRRGSTCSRMSVSMQSLNENEAYNGEYDNETLNKYSGEMRGSLSSLRSSTTPVRSASSLSAGQLDRVADQSDASSLVGSRSTLDDTQPLGEASSIPGLSESYNQESFLHSRAISMSSGLDTAHGPRKRKTSRSNRVTWVASESLTDYFRRLIQDEKTREMQSCHSYQDFSTIPEDMSPKTDSKGRRLSYQRAVSGEDPVLPTKYQDSSLRRKKITETAEGSNELSVCLAAFSRTGLPSLVGYQVASITDEALAYLLWAESQQNLDQHLEGKRLAPHDEARQAVIKELIHTEADHIRHLMNIVEIYITAAHALQDVDKLLDLNTSRLFLNIPDVLNASMKFWELVMHPMIAESYNKHTEFNADLMAPGFAHFAEIFEPYEDFVCNQTKAADYLRALSARADFKTYLTWCENRNPSSRLQLSDIMVKPMQRLTKYSLLLRRIASYTTSEESKIKLSLMEHITVNFVHRVNRAIRQREEIRKLEELEKQIDAYDVEFKDEDLDRYFHMVNELNLRSPMLNCGPHNRRALIHQGDIRFKDNLKEFEARAFLFTDMLLICKKLSKGAPCAYKAIRPKYMLARTVLFPRFAQRTIPDEINGLIYVVVDDHGTAFTAFCISEPAKDPNPLQTLKLWDQKIREARHAYELSVWFHAHPVKDLSEIETDYTTEAFRSDHHDDWVIERRSRELVAAMLHPNRKPSTCHESRSTNRNDSFEPGRGPPNHRHQRMHRISTVSSNTRHSRLSSYHQSTSSRNSRLSSFHQSGSGPSHDDAPNAMKQLYKAGSSVEHLIPPLNPDDVPRSITVNVVSESECETVVPSRQPSPQPPVLVLQQPSPHHSPGPRSASVGGSQNTLRVISPQHSMVHSLPDLSSEQTQVKPAPPPIRQSASEKLYQSHQELLQRNRLAASHQFLSPHHRGTSYPPPSPTRASLKRGLAFSYSFKTPPLLKMEHVDSDSQVNIDQSQPSTSQMKDPVPSTSADKGDKKKHSVSNRSSSSPDSETENKTNNEDPPSEDDKKSRKGKSDKKQ